MSYLLQVQRGIDYIEDHLDQEIDIRDVSRIAGASHWHFQRMFKAMTLETLKGYLRSRRLANASSALLRTEAKVLDIALQAGFSSQASFTRAFQKMFALPPAAYRERAEHLFVEKAKIDIEYLQHIHKGVSLTPSIENTPRKVFVGIQTEIYGVDSERNNIGSKLPPLWSAFLARMSEIENTVPGRCYGVVRPAEHESEELLYCAGIEIEPGDSAGGVPEGMVRFEIPASRYAVFQHRGLPTALDHTVNYIYSVWMGQSSERHSYGADIEIYGSEYSVESEDSIMSYAIPLR